MRVYTICYYIMYISLESVYIYIYICILPKQAVIADLITCISSSSSTTTTKTTTIITIITIITIMVTVTVRR